MWHQELPTNRRDGASGAIFISQGIFDEQFNPDGGKGGGPGNLAPSAPA
jgi:hypothetical protein